MIVRDPQIASLSVGLIKSLRRALDEDVGPGDVTTESIIPPDARMDTSIIAKQRGVIAGLDVVQAVVSMLDPGVQVDAQVAEGSRVESGQRVASLSGDGRALLTAERTALNCLGRMSGIATLTRRYVDAVAGTKAVILDTRKTAPGLRELDKLAVLRGGGQNHRMGLFDMILIKDNHIDVAGSLSEAVRRARLSGSQVEIEVEARTLADVAEALDLKVSHILLDNMSLEEMRQAAALNAGRSKLEASGNITEQNVRQVAETGVDFISVGALTHSVMNFDITMLMQR